MIHTVRLTNNSVGTMDTDTLCGQHPEAYIGEVVIIHLRDENGNGIEAEGVLAEVLE